MNNFRFDPFTGRPLENTRPWTDNSYAPRGIPQTPAQSQPAAAAEQPSVVVTRVASYDEAKAVPTDFSGVLRLMLDWSHGYIYAKALGDDGAPVFRKFRFEPEAPAPAPAVYVTKDEAERLVQEATAAAMRAMREEFSALQLPAKETAEKSSGKGSKA